MSLSQSLSPVSRALAVYLVISSAFNLQIVVLVKLLIGHGGFTILVYGLLILAAAAVIVYNRKQKPGIFWSMVILLSAALVVAFFMKFAVKRLHILEYGLLGFLCCRDTNRTGLGTVAAIYAVLFASLVGVTDELFQKILPYRYCDVPDMILNASSSALGAAAYLTAVYKNRVK